MPPTTGKSGLFAKYGAKLQKAFEEHKGEEVQYSNFGDLPAGIENGIAELRECKFDTYKKGDMTGEYYFYARAVVISPTTFTDKQGNVCRTEGLGTSIMEPVCDTPNRSRKTTADHVQWIMNELRKLGAPVDEGDVNTLELCAAALVAAKPMISFRTWKGEPSKEFPNPRVNHQWNGLAEHAPPDAGSAVEDHSSAAATATVSPSKNGAATVEPPTFQLMELAQQANEGDPDAATRLTELARAKGHSEQAITDTKDWDEVARLAETDPEEGGGEETAEEEVVEESGEAIPEVGEVFQYQPVKDGKKGPAVSVEVKVVNAAKRTVDVLNLANRKTLYKGVSFDSLKGD